MKKHSGYMTRAMKAKDPRFARVLGKLGHTPRPDADAVVEDEDEVEPAPKKTAEPKKAEATKKKPAKRKPRKKAKK